MFTFFYFIFFSGLCTVHVNTSALSTTQLHLFDVTF